MDGTRATPLPRIAVLVSGNGSNLQALIDATGAGQVAADIVLVAANRDDAYGLERARRAAIATEIITPGDDEQRHDYDARLGEVVAEHRPDVVVLAGWMRILSDAFIARFPNRIINLHPALPGELPGLHAIERAWQETLAGERTHTGVMVHLVPDEGVDSGPVIATTTVEIRIDDTLDTLTERVHAAEHELLVDALANFLSDLPNTLERS